MIEKTTALNIGDDEVKSNPDSEKSKTPTKAVAGKIQKCFYSGKFLIFITTPFGQFF